MKTVVAGGETGSYFLHSFSPGKSRTGLLKNKKRRARVCEVCGAAQPPVLQPLALKNSRAPLLVTAARLSP
ncbi:hypothetical protein E2C01_088525 [Portunus trituberculatus]|uniref:Uncharacterized protein n=1 Tax=Portunus trituberculatus TaxID=210409 RepID=A0A5B7JEW9_PORTR|nr:hypothetical protein [Portunus trituberculatus]